MVLVLACGARYIRERKAGAWVLVLERSWCVVQALSGTGRVLAGDGERQVLVGNGHSACGAGVVLGGTG